MKLVINAIPIRPGGGLTVLLGVLDGLRRNRDPLDITVLTGAPETTAAVQNSATADRVETYLSEAGAAKSFLWQNFLVGNFVRDSGADILLAFNHYVLNVPCHQVIYHLNLRRFSREHRSGGPLERLKENIRDWSARRAMHHAAVNVYESGFLRRAAEVAVPHASTRRRVIYIGLPDEVIDSATTTSDVYDGRPRLIAVTSPIAHKDNPTMLRTMAELQRRAPEVAWHLDVVGGTDPVAWKPFQEFARQLKVDRRITWHGYCDHGRMDTLLRRSLCLLSTSRMESFAMVAIESMARRCPPIVARTAAMPESVGDAGLLVTPGAAGEFADAILQLHRQPEKRRDFVQRGLQWIEPFRWSTCGNQFRRLFDEIVQQKAAA